MSCPPVRTAWSTPRTRSSTKPTAPDRRPATTSCSQYSDLLYGSSSLTNSELPKYFNDESFGVKPADITRTETPGEGVTIYRDKHDVPHIYGDTNPSAAFGAGYAQAEDRLFLMDVLRHYGSGTLASFLGASCEFEQMDHDQLLLAPYTKAQAQAQVDALPKKYGKDGTLAKQMLDSYVDGVNAYIAATQTDPNKLPADYVAAAPDQALPQKWTDADVVSIAGLIGGIFGRGGGFEVEDAHLLTYLQKRYGTADGLRAYHQINHQNDPLAPTTITDKTFKYDVRTKPWDQSLNALPADGALTGGPQSTSPGCGDGSSPTPPAVPGIPLGATTRAQTAKNIITSLNAMPKHMSNALVVNGSKTRSGHPIAVFGPQVSYFAPQILSLLDIHAPDYAAMGASFPGTGLVELGRGKDYAWSATSASSDLIDMRVEKICNPVGWCTRCQRHVVHLQRQVRRHAAGGVRRDRSAQGERDRRSGRDQAHHLQDAARHRAGLDHGEGPAGRDRDPALDVQPRHRLGRRLPRLR